MSTPQIPTLDEIREKTLAVFGCDPCRWQSLSCQASLGGDNDIINIAPTGAGKTLTFWMPLLFRKDGIQIVVTPLNILGAQNEAELAKANIHTVAVRADTATPRLFRVSHLNAPTSQNISNTYHCDRTLRRGGTGLLLSTGRS